METAIFEYPLAWLTASFFAMPRLLAMFSVIPLFNKQALPGLLRIGVAFSFAIFVIPSLESQALSISRSGSTVLMLSIKEVVIGFLMGFLIAIPIWAIDIVGVYVDNQRGAGIASTINPMTGHDSSPLGELFSQAGIVLLLISGGMVLILSIVFESYLIWPVFQLMPKLSPETPVVLLDLMDKLMLLAVLLSAPVIFSMFLAELGLGLVSRFVPQLQVFFLAMPVKSALAFFIFSIYTGLLMQYTQAEIVDLGVSVLATLKSVFLPLP